MSESVVIADIGGTNARFETLNADGIQNPDRFKCADFISIADMAEAYFAKTGLKDVKKMILSLACPVIEDAVDFPNNHFAFSRKDMQEKLGLSSMQAMNDFVAVAHGIAASEPHQIKKLNEAIPQDDGCKSIIGLGTGLGMAHVTSISGRNYAQAAWGGASAMSFQTDREDQLKRQLQIDLKGRHISTEDVCCGPGLVRVYDAIRRMDNRTDLPDLDGSQISHNARNNLCDASKESLDLMLGFLGRIAGNNALVHNSHGGVYVTGGLVVAMGDYFEKSAFMREFTNKGAASDFVRKMAVYQVLDTDPGMLGLRSLAKLEIG